MFNIWPFTAANGRSHCSPFKLKELEKLGPKMKGIGARDLFSNGRNNLVLTRFAVSQSVKEVVQSLVDDGLVQYDKIGSSNCAYSVVSRFREGHTPRVH